MADILLDEQGAPTTPAAGQGVIFIDTYNILCMKDEAGIIWGRSENASIASQGAGFATDTYVTDSDIRIPSFSFQVRTLLRWSISASKTAASTATPIYTLRVGSNRSTADTARLTLTGPAQTAAADVGVLHIYVIVRSIGAAGIIQGTAAWDHNLGTATGFGGSAEGTSAGFDNSALGGLYIGLSINGGTSAAWTITQVRVEAKW